MRTYIFLTFLVHAVATGKNVFTGKVDMGSKGG